MYLDHRVTEKLHQEDSPMNVLAVFDRRLYPCSETREPVIKEMLDDLFLLEHEYYPVNGIMTMLAYPDEIKKVIDSGHVSALTIIE